MDSGLPQTLQQLQALDFTGKGEAFVEQKFVTPLLECLGYESHKDYEVTRHGDDGARFKLHYPPVERGAKPVKHYNPDYAPKIRKKMFWIIEAKSAKDLSYPFDVAYLVQGLQYCIHPEIQAQYLLVTNGVHTAIYDAHGSVFLGREMYEPILEFKSAELVEKWDDIYRTLSVETLRTRIERDLKAAYDKLSLSSLDRDYPRRLLQTIGQSVGDNVKTIEAYVRTLYLEEKQRVMDQWLQNLEANDASYAYAGMDMPLAVGTRSEANYFVAKSRADGVADQAIFDKLTHDFVDQGIFRKIQSFVGLCDLFQVSQDDEIKNACREFFDLHKGADLPLRTQVECAALRTTRKLLMISQYPQIRARIEAELATAPEMVRFVKQPTALEEMYPYQLEKNMQVRQIVRLGSDVQLRDVLANLLAHEQSIESAYRDVLTKLPDNERELAGFDTYGVGGKHYAFKNILMNRGIDPRT